MSEASTTPGVTITREYGPFDDEPTHGVTYDGRHVWFATGTRMRALEPDGGEVVRSLPVSSDAGTAFDGQHLYQLTGEHIQKVDAETGEIVARIDAPGKGRDSGLTWAEGLLWVGQFRERTIHCVDPSTGEIKRTIESDRFVTGVTWTDGELWHATWENETSDLRRIDPESGEVLERHDLPEGVNVAGLSSDGERFYGGSGSAGRIRVIERAKPAATS